MASTLSWYPHKTHFEAYRKLGTFDRLAQGVDYGNAPMCGSPLRVTDPDSVGSTERTLVNPLGCGTMPVKMTTDRTKVTCGRCRIMLSKKR